MAAKNDSFIFGGHFDVGYFLYEKKYEVLCNNFTQRASNECKQRKSLVRIPKKLN
jgi:hypothetical protein